MSVACRIKIAEVDHATILLVRKSILTSHIRINLAITCYRTKFIFVLPVERVVFYLNKLTVSVGKKISI